MIVKKIAHPTFLFLAFFFFFGNGPILEQEGFEVLVDIKNYSEENLNYITESIQTDRCSIESELIEFIDFRDIPGILKDGVAVLHLYGDCEKQVMLRDFYVEKMRGQQSRFFMLAPIEGEAKD